MPYVQSFQVIRQWIEIHMKRESESLKAQWIAETIYVTIRKVNSYIVFSLLQVANEIGKILHETLRLFIFAVWKPETTPSLSYFII